MAEIPEHLLKRAQAAREKAESQQKTETTDSTQPQETEETKEVEETMKTMSVEKKKVEEQEILVGQDEAVAQEKAEQADKLKATCSERLAVAEPMLKAALKALKTLKAADFTEMKAYKKPPPKIKICMEAVCILLEKKPKKVQRVGACLVKHCE